jgi:hypothetical protein
MVDDTDDMWWLKHEGESTEGEGETDIHGSGTYVTAYSKSPFVGALPWISGLALASLLVLGQLPAISSIDIEVIGLGCLALFFLFVFSAVLLTNDELGVRISVNTEESLIDVAHRGLMTELKSKSRIKYGSADHIQLDIRREVTETRDSDGSRGTAVAVWHDVQLCRPNGSRKTIFSTNGPFASRRRAVRIGKSIARITGLDYLS